MFSFALGEVNDHLKAVTARLVEELKAPMMAHLNTDLHKAALLPANRAVQERIDRLTADNERLVTELKAESVKLNMWLYEAAWLRDNIKVMDSEQVIAGILRLVEELKTAWARLNTNPHTDLHEAALLQQETLFESLLCLGIRDEPGDDGLTSFAIWLAYKNHACVTKMLRSNVQPKE